MLSAEFAAVPSTSPKVLMSNPKFKTQNSQLKNPSPYFWRMKKIFFILSFLMLGTVIYAQDIDYRSKENTHYWKNRKPHAGYWQQDVHYTIKGDVREKTNIIDASEHLEYFNNSPHQLDVVYFHLYQNAFTKESYLSDLHKSNNDEVKNLGRYSSVGLGTTVHNVKVDGREVKTELDNTILKVYLNKPLKSGGSIEIDMDFITFFDSKGYRRRMAEYKNWGWTHFNGVHWYPRISVYDIKKGWDLDQHLNKELYGDYGRFDVELTFANNYVVEATGQLMNPKEVFPGDLRERLDIKNFKDKPWGEKPSIITPYDSTQRKTWKFTGVNVHDFAFTADPAYRLGEAEWNGVKCIAIVDESHCIGWQKTPDYMTKIIKTFSEDFGMYEYPKIVAADANDGMEYPMITLDGGRDPDNHGLLIHEIAHNWFYGMIGNNETYRAALDEGFTQFLTSWGQEKIDGKYLVATPPKSNYLKKHKKGIEARERSVFYRYVYDVVRAEDATLNTHSNDFHGAIGHENGYGLVYYKTATMLYNLQYVLGEEKFSGAMKHYVAQWKFAHPYFDDFKKSIVEYTHQDLDWFFDQFLETTKTLDYGIEAVQKTNITDKYNIKLHRAGEMQMPLDIRIVSKRGETFDYYIPNQPYEKETDAYILPKWYGWGILNRDYEFKAKVPGGIKSVEIDPSHRLPDMYPMDNSKTPGTLLNKNHSFELDRGITQFPNRNQYVMTWRPDIWWNAVDGIKAGLHVEGSYLNYAHKFDASVWWNTHLLQKEDYYVREGQPFYDKYSPVDFTINYATPIRSTDNKIQWGLGARAIEGFAKQYLFGDYVPNKNNRLRLSAARMWRYGDNHADYLFFPNEWSSVYNGSDNEKTNSYFQLDYFKSYRKAKSAGTFRATMRLPLPSFNEDESFNYSYFELEGKHNTYWKKLDIRTRAMFRAGIGDNVPTESALYLAGANPEQLMENKYTRSQGIMPLTWGGYSTTGFANMHSGGGLNLRGYNGYYAIDDNDQGEIFINYKGLSGASASIEVEFDRLFNCRPKAFRNWLHFDTYLFADGGVIARSIYDPNNITTLNRDVDQFSKFRMDAGLGMAMTIKKWGVFDKAQPLTIRFDVPFFLSAPPFGQEYLDFRWVIGVNRAF